MKIKTKHIDDLKFEISNDKSVMIINPKEMSPVEIFAGAMISCSGVDVVHLGEVILNYDIESNADDVKAKRWVLSSLETYCSTINTIRATAKIYYTIKHNGNVIAYKETILSGGGSTNTHQHDSFDDDLEGMGCACCNH